MSMITAIEFDEFISPGISPRYTQCTHAGFGTTAHHPHQVYIWRHAFDQFGHLYFKLSWRTKGSSFTYFLLYGFYYRFICMTQDQRPPTRDIVNVFIAIRIIEI